MKNIVYFDFCNTLVGFETANEFVRYVIRNEGSQSSIAEMMREALTFFHLRNVANKFHKSISVNKALWLYQLKGLSKETINRCAYSFYQERIKPELILPVLNKLIWYKDNDYKVLIVSGGYDAYISFFSMEFGVDYICTELSYIDNTFRGKIIGRDCMNYEKPLKISDYLHKNGLHRDDLYQIGYSDSPSDIPMLSMCNERYVVMKGQSFFPSWANTIRANVITY